jgi:hypothetical protein
LTIFKQWIGDIYVFQSLKIKSSAMSAQIKNTLFRFAALRIPEPVTAKVKAGYQVYQQDQGVENETKIAK